MIPYAISPRGVTDQSIIGLLRCSLSMSRPTPPEHLWDRQRMINWKPYGSPLAKFVGLDWVWGKALALDFFTLERDQAGENIYLFGEGRWMNAGSLACGNTNKKIRALLLLELDFLGVNLSHPGNGGLKSSFAVTKRAGEPSICLGGIVIAFDKPTNTHIKLLGISPSASILALRSAQGRRIGTIVGTKIYLENIPFRYCPGNSFEFHGGIYVRNIERNSIDHLRRSTGARQNLKRTNQCPAHFSAISLLSN